MATIDLSFSSENEFRTKFAATPADWVAAGNRYRFLQTNSEIVLTGAVVLEGKVTGPDNDMEIVYMPGASFMDNSGILTNPYAYSGTAGAAARINVGFISGMFQVKMPYVKFTGYQMRQMSGSGGPVVKVFAGGGNVTLDRCILDGFGSSQYDFALEINDSNFTAISTLIVHNSNLAVAAYVNSKTAKFENVSFIRPSTFTKGGYAVRITNDGCTFDNCSFFGFDAFIENPGGQTIVRNCGGSGTIPPGTGNLPNLVAADNLVNPASDYRTKAGSALINAGRTPSANNTRAPNGVRQQGTAADIGAWEVPDALVAPTAEITDISVTGQTVVISGVTTGAPTSGSVTISPSGVDFNNAGTYGPKAVTLSTNAFTVEFDAALVGSYKADSTFANQAYSVAGSNAAGNFEVIGAYATSLVQDIDGQVLTLEFDTVGNPTSGFFTVPAADGQTDVYDQTGTVTLTPGHGVARVELPPGSFKAGRLTLSNAAGHSRPQAGTSAVTIVGISGNIQAPESGGEQPEEPNPPIALISAPTVQQNASSVAAVTVPGAVVRTATVKLVARQGAAPLTTMTGLKWAWWDQPTPDLLAAPRNKGILGTIDPSVDLVLNIPNSALQSGGIGCVAITNDDGDAEGGHMAFFGSVRVN